MRQTGGGVNQAIRRCGPNPTEDSQTEGDFFAPNGKFVVSAGLLLSVFYTRLIRHNKVETGCGLLT